MSAPTSNELQLLEIFRRRLLSQNLSLPSGQSNSQHLLRWIRARESDLDKAEDMLKKHLQWRKSCGIGPSLLDYMIQPYLTKNYPIRFLGFDPKGSPILLMLFGQWDMRPALEKGYKEGIKRYKDKFLEEIMLLMHLYEEWANKKNSGNSGGLRVTQFIAISDWTGFSLRYIMNKEVVEIILEAAKSFEANYPETLKAAFNINCPKVFAIFFNLVKPFLTERTLSKIKIFDQNATKWKPELAKVVPKSLIPGEYGGNGDKEVELNDLKIKEGDEELERIMEESLNGDRNDPDPKKGGFGDVEFTNVKVAPGYKVHVPCKLMKIGNRISWHVSLDEKDIGFSVLYHNESSLLTKEVVKYQRVEESVGSVICEKMGNYSLAFDNTYSTFKPKVVGYKVMVDDPFCIN